LSLFRNVTHIVVEPIYLSLYPESKNDFRNIYLIFKDTLILIIWNNSLFFCDNRVIELNRYQHTIPTQYTTVLPISFKIVHSDIDNYDVVAKLLYERNVYCLT